jgi:hypothetical protein
MDQIYVGTPVEFHVVEDHSGKNGGKRRATNVRLPPSGPDVIEERYRSHNLSRLLSRDT